MAEAIFDLQVIFVILLLWLFSAFFFIPFFFFKKPEKSMVRSPPSPLALPIIGNLLYLVSFPSFKCLQKLSYKYGPVLHLRVFGFSVVIVSSASVAYDVYKTQDANLTFRDNDITEDSLVFGLYSFTSAPYGDYYKFMRKLLATKLLGQQHLLRSRVLRGEEIERFYGDLVEKARRKEVIVMYDEIMKLTNNIICRMMMGRRCNEENGEANEFQDLIVKTNSVLKKIMLANALRSLKRLGVTSWFEKELMQISNRYDMFLEKILKEHEEDQNEEHRDIMDLLLEALHDENAEYKLTRKHIKAFLVELFVAGTDSSAAAMLWTIAEIMDHPDVIKKMREEIDGVVGQSRLIQETDLPNLPYLQAVVKEGLRLHPPGALIPRTSKEPCRIGGFDIQGRQMFLMNVYAINRDPEWWEDPDEFRPERFLVSSTREQEDIKEKAVKYAPFGGGRRVCPAQNFTYLSMGMVMGTMFHYFDWNIEGDKVNKEETGVFSCDMAHPLKCTPLLRFNPCIG